MAVVTITWLGMYSVRQEHVLALDDGADCYARRPPSRMLYKTNRVLAIAHYQGTGNFEAACCERAASQCTDNRSTLATRSAIVLDHDCYRWFCPRNLVLDIPDHAAL